ncbi:MAG: hypothetical protein HOM08_12485 [Candidatus Marinimicrobia bacterium]|jgi:hypothetical protein|nr:hypothetical protein [Candidatus Neomarinimicrobiota bacterium]
MQKIKQLIHIYIFIFLSLTFGISDTKKTIVYDTNQMNYEGIYILPLPEIKIKFDELAEQFNIGDKLSIRMSTENSNLSQVSWFYPPTHNISGSFSKRTIKKIARLSLETRVDSISIRSRAFPVPKLRVISRDILGSARSKVSSLYQFGKENNELIEFDILEGIEQEDMLRMKGLYLGISEIKTIGKTIFQYRKNSGPWLPLDSESFLIGSTKISVSRENRFLRIKDGTYHPDIDIETGEFSSLRFGNNLKLSLSDEFDGRWVDNGSQRILVESEGRRDSVTVTPLFTDKEILFSLADLNYNQSKISFPDLKLQCLSSVTDPLTQGRILVHSNISSSLLVDETSEYILLDQISDPIIFMNPQVEVVGGKQRSFFKTDSSSSIDLRIKAELGGKLIPGDTIRIILPDGHPISWGRPQEDSNNSASVINIDDKILGIIVKTDITNILLINSLSLNMPNRSIPPFNLQVVYPFLLNMHRQIVKNDLRYGHIDINLSQSQMVNTKINRGMLKRVIVQEDKQAQMSQRGDLIQINVSGDNFDFDVINLNKMEIKNVDKSNSSKLTINYSNSDDHKIVLNILSPLDLGEKIYVDNIPIHNIREKLNEVQLKYQVNGGGIETDKNSINMIYANAYFASDNNFIRDVNESPQLLSLSDLNIELLNLPGYGQTGQFLIIRLPSGIASWSSSQKPIIHPQNSVEIEYINKREIALYAGGINEGITNINIAGLSIIPEQDMILGEKLNCFFATDSNIAFSTNRTFSYTYPTFRSIDDQIFFIDDTTWNVYDLEINTGSLVVPILPGNYITLNISDPDIQWDHNSNKLRNVSVNGGLLSNHVFFDRNNCHIVAADKIEGNTQLIISGLKIKPVTFAVNQFILKMSLDEGATICAEDFEGKTLKTVKLENELSEKVNRAIQENAYSMETGRTISLNIPESFPIEWDESIQSIQRVDINNKTQIQKGDIDFAVLDERVTYPNKKTVQLKIRQGYGTIDQGLRLSGPIPKKLYFKGLKLLSPTPEDFPSEARLNVIVETPYGQKIDNKSTTGWQLFIDGISNYSSLLNDNQSANYILTTPQISTFNGREVFDDIKLQLYAEEQVLLRRPLIDFENSNSDEARLNLENSLICIVGLYNDTEPKGANWKTWYYLAWLKKRSIELNILEKILAHDLIKNQRALYKSSYSEDIDRATIHGYSPLTRHQSYPSITMGALLTDINSKIDAAVLKYMNNNVFEAELELLVIKREILSDEKLSYLAAKIDYWLARIAIALDDSEYVTYQQSYAFQKLRNARRIYSEYAPLFTRDTWLGDSINIYRNIAMDRVNLAKQEKLINLKIIKGKKEILDFQQSSYEFYYGNDYSYAISLKGVERDNIALLNMEDKSKYVYHDHMMSPTFGQPLKFNKGGEYELKFSPARQTMYNIFLSSIILISIGMVYVQ